MFADQLKSFEKCCSLITATFAVAWQVTSLIPYFLIINLPVVSHIDLRHIPNSQGVAISSILSGVLFGDTQLSCGFVPYNLKQF